MNMVMRVLQQMVIEGERLERHRHEKLALLEEEIRAGCTQCHGPMLVGGVPNGIIVYKQGLDFDIGRPYCWGCAHKRGWCCEPGDDYTI